MKKQEGGSMSVLPLPNAEYQGKIVDGAGSFLRMSVGAKAPGVYHKRWFVLTTELLFYCKKVNILVQANSYLI
jgi:hypothetical protein